MPEALTDLEFERLLPHAQQSVSKNSLKVRDEFTNVRAACPASRLRTGNWFDSCTMSHHR